MLVLMTFTNPEVLREITQGKKTFLERVENHPTRPAKAYEFNTWWEDAGFMVLKDGAVVKDGIHAMPYLFVNMKCACAIVRNKG